MTNVPADAVPFFSPGSRPAPLPDVDAGPQSRRRYLLAGIAALVVATGGLVATRVITTDADVSTGVRTSPIADAIADRSAYAPGGSVYGQQVPTQAGDLSAYAPGGSVYGQQVPTQAGDLSAYVPGGSIYRQQVPTTPR